MSRLKQDEINDLIFKLEKRLDNGCYMAVVDPVSEQVYGDLARAWGEEYYIYTHFLTENGSVKRTTWKPNRFVNLIFFMLSLAKIYNAQIVIQPKVASTVREVFQLTFDDLMGVPSHDHI